MPIQDFWMQAILSSTPSPVPSIGSNFSNDENNLATPLPFWNPTLIQQFLALYQMSQSTNQIFAPQQNLNQNLKIQNQNEMMPSRKRPFLDEKEKVRKVKSRKLGEDTVTQSPVSGMFIKEECDVAPLEELQKEADLLDETAAYVDVTEESRRKISQIPNLIGDCICRLCKVKYDDVFRLAQHKCPRIAHEEYKCPDCDKTFSCPANLASHRRWHKPREMSAAQNLSTQNLSCLNCFSIFPTRKILKAHTVTCQRSPLQSLLARCVQ
ncbi:unnamed protein product [Caenorhabditis angaria]|uniref:C2H2-type domain-containing protein n=1 Tax=Caenorhabditis angaria TaxID=860376 RepID=A0A9P1N464_9PELO|nr:unnamed protein product [Caenorhabditis angaria]